MKMLRNIFFLTLISLFTTSNIVWSAINQDEEIGTVSNGTLVDPDQIYLPKYDNMSLWFSVIDEYKKLLIEKDHSETRCCEIINESFANNGFLNIAQVIKNPELSQTKAFEFEGMDYFDIAFNNKVNDFKMFSMEYLNQISHPNDRPCFEIYSKEAKHFGCILQKCPFPENNNIVQIGDLHGNIIALLTILKKFEQSFNRDFSLNKKDLIFVFTGDYIDRIPFGLEVLFILMTLKIKNPNNVFLLMGNHEAFHHELIGYKQGFVSEIANKLNFGAIEFTEKRTITGNGAKQCIAFMQSLQENVFKFFSSALFMETDRGCIMFCHGLLNPNNKQIERFLNLKNMGIAITEINTQTQSLFDGYIILPGISPRLAASDSLHDAVESYMSKNNIRLCVRGHQHNESIDAKFNIEFGGILYHKLSDTSAVITTSSYDHITYKCTPAKIEEFGFTPYAIFCVINNSKDQIIATAKALDINTLETTTCTNIPGENLTVNKRLPLISLSIELIEKEVEEAYHAAIFLPDEEYQAFLKTKCHDQTNIMDLRGLEHHMASLGLIEPAILTIKAQDKDLEMLLSLVCDKNNGIFAVINKIRYTRKLLVNCILQHEPEYKIKALLLILEHKRQCLRVMLNSISKILNISSEPLEKLLCNKEKPAV